jgi:hypothetical protein
MKVTDLVDPGDGDDESEGSRDEADETVPDLDTAPTDENAKTNGVEHTDTASLISEIGAKNAGLLGNSFAVEGLDLLGPANRELADFISAKHTDALINKISPKNASILGLADFIGTKPADILSPFAVGN